jgi:hypothetical protein
MRIAAWKWRTMLTSICCPSMVLCSASPAKRPQVLQGAAQDDLNYQAHVEHCEACWPIASPPATCSCWLCRRDYTRLVQRKRIGCCHQRNALPYQTVGSGHACCTQVSPLQDLHTSTLGEYLRVSILLKASDDVNRSLHRPDSGISYDMS